MEYELVIVPPGGGEADHSRLVRGASSIPAVGEYVQVLDGDGRGRMYFVNLVRTDVRPTPDDKAWVHCGVVVLAEPVLYSRQSDGHSRLVSIYESRGKRPREYPETGY